MLDSVVSEIEEELDEEVIGNQQQGPSHESHDDGHLDEHAVVPDSELSQELLNALTDPEADPELVMKALELGLTAGGTVEQLLEEEAKPWRPQDDLPDPTIQTVPYDYYGDDIKYVCAPSRL